MDKKTSIVIPTFNRAQYIKKCIDSCLAQTVPCEIIVSDHGSTDSTPDVVKEYGNKITYLRREKDNGVHFCWLDGIINASNEFIHLQFDDDWIEPTFIEKCLQLMSDDVGMAVTNYVLFDDETKEIKTTAPFLTLKNKKGIYDSSFFLKEREYNLISPACVLYRKDILIKYMFIDKIPFANVHYKGVGPDLLFFLMSCLEYKNVAYVDEYLAIFRLHKNSITTDAGKNDEKQRKLTLAYESARHLYLVEKFVKKTGIVWFLRKLLALSIRIKRIR